MPAEACHDCTTAMQGLKISRLYRQNEMQIVSIGFIRTGLIFEDERCSAGNGALSSADYQYPGVGAMPFSPSIGFCGYERMSDKATDLAWDDFRLIRAIAEARTLPGAAERLGINHSTVFRRLKQIEETLGLPLFEKSRTGYGATPCGEEIVALTERLDEDISAVMLKLAGREIVPSGELRVATNDTLLVNLLTPLFGKFRQAFPDIRLDILIGNQPANLARRDADVAIRATDAPPETLVGRRAAHIAWALYTASSDSGEAPSLEREDYAVRNWVCFGEQLGSFKLTKWAEANLPPERIVYKLNTVLGLAEAVEAGIGIGFLPCFIGDARSSLRRLAPPMPEFGTDLWLLTHPDLRNAPRIRAFLDFLAAEIAVRRKLIEGEAI